MKKMIYLLISIYSIKLISGQCFSYNPSNKEACNSKETDSTRCCYIEYRTDIDSNYKTVCLEFLVDDIKKGLHEKTIQEVEGGTYNATNWNDTMKGIFKNYASINDFDCKGKFISKSLLLFSSLLIISLI